MLIPQYLGRVWTFTFQRFAIRTDAMQVVAASAVPAVAPLFGLRNPADANSEVLAYIGFAALAFIAIRLLCAPYFIWKEDRARIDDLEKEIARPERREEEAGLEHRIALRRELGENLAKLIALAEFSTVPATFALLYTHKADELIQNKIRFRELLSLLSYDVALRVTCFNLQNLCDMIITASSKGEDTKSLLERLWAQRKLTFKLIHRDDDVNDLMTMVEIENIIAEHGESFASDKPTTDERVLGVMNKKAELRALAKQLGPDLHLLGKQRNLGNFNPR